MVAPRFPYPPVRGDQLVTYNRLRTLGRRHQVTLLSYADGPVDPSGLLEIREFCERVEVVRRAPWRALASVAARGAASRVPLQVLYYRSAAFRTRLGNLIHKDRPDVVHGILLRVAPYLESVADRTILEPVDSMTLNLERRLHLERGVRRRLVAHELGRVRQYERYVASRFPHLVFVSKLDADAAGAPDATVLPLGVDPERFRPAPPPCGPVVAFTGNMGYGPNVHAVSWFVQFCWPAILRAVPDARLVIAGRDPTPAVRRLGMTPGVTVAGAVEDMGAVLAGASVAVAPMRSGSGMQNKVLEAMAAARPVVTTTLGLGDLHASPGIEIMVEDHEEPFRRRVIALLLDPQGAATIGAAARAYVLRHHSWESAAAEIERLYARVTG